MSVMGYKKQQKQHNDNTKKIRERILTNVHKTMPRILHAAPTTLPHGDLQENQILMILIVIIISLESPSSKYNL